MKRVLVAFLLIVATSISGISVAKAETKVYSKTSNLDTYNRPDLNFKYDIQKVEVGMYDSDLDMLHFWILFAQPLTSSMFNDNQGSWAGILIDTNNDGTDDIVINTLARSYTSNYGQTASAAYRNGTKSCPTTSWMDLDNKTGWLGFKVSQKCLGLSNKFYVQGYADYVSTDNASYDYAPDSYELIDLGDYYNPKPKVTMTVPQTTSDIGKSLSNYSSAPENLVNLSASLRDSVATIECIVGTTGGTGTAWSAKVDISISAYKSYLITNYHVISDCVSRGTVDVILNNNTKITGTLAAWDPDNDVAGIYVSTYVPPLLWQGEQPVQGGWVGVIGSPKGLPGVLTTGIISSVSTSDKYITFTAPINPGNSGGPVFDSVGRVVAIATAKVRDSEGFAIGNGVPLICTVVVKCSSTLTGWGSKPNVVVVETTKKYQNITANYRTSYTLPGTLYIIQSTGTSSGNSIFAYSDAGLTLKVESLTPNICAFSNSMWVDLVRAGTCIIKMSQDGNASYYAATKTIQFDIEGKKSQSIEATPIPNQKLSSKVVKIDLSATSGLDVYASSDTESICEINQADWYSTEWEVTLKKAGTCKLSYFQQGDTEYLAAPTLYESFTISGTVNKTITCIKGKSVAKITGVNPVCPSGYKKK